MGDDHGKHGEDNGGGHGKARAGGHCCHGGGHAEGEHEGAPSGSSPSPTTWRS